MKKKSLLKTKTDKKQFIKWLKALRSGEYKQGKGRLEPKKGEFCCLGVACKTIIPLKKQKMQSSGNLLSGFQVDFSNQPFAPEWLIDVNSDFFIKSRSGKTLVTLNDFQKNTFKQIASKLERVYKKELDAIK